MKAALFYGRRDIRVKDVPVPELAVGEVLIKIEYCGICGSDLEAYRTGHYEPETIIGHEFSGTLVAVGEGVTEWSVGDRVVANGTISCDDCFYCKRGEASLCDNIQLIGITFDSGGFAEYCRVPVKTLYRLPEEVSLLEGAVVDPVANALHAVKSSMTGLGDRVLVIGGGPIGLLVMQGALLAGAADVYITELNSKRLDLANRLGATAAINPMEKNVELRVEEYTDGLGMDVVFCCAGNSEAIASAISLARKGGQIYIYGICEEPVQADFFSVVLNELQIKGGYASFDEYDLAIKLIKQHKIKVKDLVTDIIPLDDVVNKGFEELIKENSGAVKILIKP